MQKEDTLHITNGDSAATLILESGIDGDVLPWRDPMHHGPFPAGSALRDCSEIRARYLAGPNAEQATIESIRQSFHERDTLIEHYQNFSETILWFEHDLLDQLQLLQILSAISNHAGVSLICINHFDGTENFRGLGELSSKQIATLFDKRIPVTAGHLSNATELWSKFCDPDPSMLNTLTDDTDKLFPFMRKALLRHLQEFPWTQDGLSRTERQLVSLIDGGKSKAGEIFSENMEFEDALFIGDWRTFHLLNLLATEPDPLIDADNGEYSPWTRGTDRQSPFFTQSLITTTTGKQALNGLPFNGYRSYDEWLGGVHLKTPDNLWFWDDQQQALVRRTNGD